MLSIAGLLLDGTFSFNNNEVIRPVHFTNVAQKLASRSMFGKERYMLTLC